MRALHVEGTQRLIEAASGTIGHWVQLSSTGAYGKVRAGTVTEKTAVAPDNEYERTKTRSDELVSAAAGPATFSATILRPSNVFGPTMSNRSLFQMIAMISKGIYFFIGQPCASANYIYVDNVVDGMLLCATLPQARGQTFILSDHRPLEEFVSAIAYSLGRPMPRARVPEQLARMIATNIWVNAWISPDHLACRCTNGSSRLFGAAYQPGAGLRSQGQLGRWGA